MKKTQIQNHNKNHSDTPPRGWHTKQHTKFEISICSMNFLFRVAPTFAPTRTYKFKQNNKLILIY